MPKIEYPPIDADALNDAVIDRKGRYVNHPADRSSPTFRGITKVIAREQVHVGATRDLPRADAAAPYCRTYLLRPISDKFKLGALQIAAEMLDTGVCMGTGTTKDLLQCALSGLDTACATIPTNVIGRDIGPHSR
jgi:lysozyme family protein